MGPGRSRRQGLVGVNAGCSNGVGQMCRTPALSCAEAKEGPECGRHIPDRYATPSRCTALGQIAVDIGRPHLRQRSSLAVVPPEKLGNVLPLSFARLLSQAPQITHPVTILIELVVEWHDNNRFVPPT